MYSCLLDYVKQKPKIYEESSSAFWDDEHISKYMLEAHLDLENDGASRTYDFMKKSADWISGYCGAGQNKSLLDLGCGPGLYAELFSEKGFSVTGVDFSKRSIEYAKHHAITNNKDIKYFYMNYLDIDYENEFDMLTLIYCDFGVLSPENRGILLKKIWKALKKDGILVFDVWGKPYLKGYKVGESIEYNEYGFWSADPHVVIQRNSYYKDTANTLEQYIVVTEKKCNCYNIWNQIYSKEMLMNELRDAGFKSVKLFDDVSGESFTGKKETICVVANK